MPPGFWFKPLPEQAAAGSRAKTRTAHAAPRTVLASAHRVAHPAPVVRQTATVAAQRPLPPLPQADPRVGYYAYPGYYPYPAGYRYYRVLSAVSVLRLLLIRNARRR